MYDKALFKEITQWTMPTREKVIIDNSHTAITPLRSGTSCVALSYANDASMCPLTMTPMLPLPRFYFFDKDMFYSTPNEKKSLHDL